MRPAPEAPSSVHASGFFCLRTHLLPFEELSGWTEDARAATAAPGGEGQAPDALVAALRGRLRLLLGRPEIREAVFVASPALDEALDHWCTEPTSDRGRRAERSLIKYLARMASRPTPFGLFSSVACGAIGPATRLAVSAAGACRRHTRLDNEYLFALAEAVGADPAVRAALRYRPNDSLNFAAGRGRYAEARAGENGHTFHLVAVEETPELRATLERAARGATRAELAAALVTAEISSADAADYVDELIESQILRADIGVPVTGPEPAATLVARVGDIPSVLPVAQGLRSAIDAIDRLDAAGLGHPSARYREIATGLESLPAKVHLPRLFQVDLARDEAGTIGPAVIREVERGVELLHRIMVPDREDVLSRFRSAFLERYEGREVPLLEALDEEVGLGSSLWPAEDPSPLLKGLPLAQAEGDRIGWDERARFLIYRAGEALIEHRDEWVLADDDLEKLASRASRPLPDAFAASATLAAVSGEAVDRGDFQLHLHFVDGPSGARLLGRFAHADAGLSARTTEHLRAEEAVDPESIYAEVVHLSDGRLGNILLRPVCRGHEITYLGLSGAPDERQIPASELLVYLEDGEIRLRSPRLGRRIVPRLTSAHNFSRGLAPYRFLCLLQDQGRTGSLAWRWGPAEAAPFLPRVRAGRLVLSLARWRLDAREIRRLTQPTERERPPIVAEWRALRRLPRWVALVDYDNLLPVDLDNPLAVDCLMHELSDREEAVLEEVWPDAERLVARGPEGRYRHELIIPFVRSAPAASARTGAAIEPKSAPAIERRLPPGSDWLYLKLYTSQGLADDLLTGTIAPISRRLVSQGDAARWFFLRYQDPEFHLRWRVQGDPEVLERVVWPEIRAALEPRLQSGAVWRVQVDTYEREVERYGGPEAIADAELIFSADSELVAGVVELLDPGDAGLDERWRLALRGADQLLGDMGLTLGEKLKLVEESGRHYGSISEPPADLRHQLTARFRELRKSVEELLDRGRDAESPLAPGLELITERSEAVRDPIARLKALAGDGRLRTPWPELAGSLVHMHLNRLLRGAPNAHEVVIYDFLRRVYQSMLARRGGKA